MRFPVQIGTAVAAGFVIMTIWPAWGGGDAQLVEMLGAFPGYALFIAAIILLALPSTRAGGWASAAFIAAMGGFTASFLVQFVEANDNVAYANGMVIALSALTLAFVVTALVPGTPAPSKVASTRSSATKTPA